MSAEELAAFKAATEQPTDELRHTHVNLSAQAQSLIHPTTGRLVVTKMGRSVDLSATEAWRLLQWLADHHRDRLWQIVQHGKQAQR